MAVRIKEADGGIVGGITVSEISRKVQNKKDIRGGWTDDIGGRKGSLPSRINLIGVFRPFGGTKGIGHGHKASKTVRARK